jgi:hypothetical protein
LVGRLQSHSDALSDQAHLSPDVVKDVELAGDIIDKFAEFIDAVAGRLPDWPEPSRSGHHSS